MHGGGRPKVHPLPCHPPLRLLTLRTARSEEANGPARKPQPTSTRWPEPMAWARLVTMTRGWWTC